MLMEETAWEVGRRWPFNIVVDFKPTACERVNWIHTAPVTVACVINLRVQKGPYLKTINFSRRILLH
jgi:hypothetical protein